MNDTIKAIISKVLSVEKAVNVAFVTLLTLSLTAIQQQQTDLILYFAKYFIFFFILYFLIPIIRTFHTWFRRKLGVEEESENDTNSRN